MKNAFGPRRVSREHVQGARNLRALTTDEENILWQHLRGNQLGGIHFRRQHPIAGFVVDFYYPKAKVVIEVDGGVHQHQVEDDAARDQVLSALGLHVLHVQNDEVMKKPGRVLVRIQHAVEMGARA